MTGSQITMRGGKRATLRLRPEASAPESGTFSAGAHALALQLRSARQEIEALKGRLGHEAELPVVGRRAFESAMTSYASGRRSAGPGAIATVRLSSLPIILERFGDRAGDAALKHVATGLSGHIRKTDLVGRLGTGQFAILLAFASADGATAKMSKLCQKLEDTPCAWDGGLLPVVLEWSVAEVSAGTAPLLAPSAEFIDQAGS